MVNGNCNGFEPFAWQLQAGAVNQVLKCGFFPISRPDFLPLRLNYIGKSMTTAGARQNHVGKGQWPVMQRGVNGADEGDGRLPTQLEFKARLQQVRQGRRDGIARYFAIPHQRALTRL